MADVTPQPTPIAPSASGGVAPQQSGFDPGPIIAASEQNLADYLNMPVHEIMDRLGIPAIPGQANQEAKPGEQDPAASNPMDPSSMITPVTDALSSLGTGIFESMDPTKLMESVSKAIESASTAMNQSASSNGSQWTGQASNASTQAAQNAAQSGQKISDQSQTVKANTAQAAAHTAKARTELMTIIATFQQLVAVNLPGIPLTLGNIIAGAVNAVTQAATVITTTQGALAGNTAAVNIAGTQVPVASLIGPGLQVGTGLLSSGLSMVTQGASTGMKTGTDMISKMSSAAKDASKTAAKTPIKDYKPLAAAGAKSAGHGIGSATPKQSLAARMGGGMPGAGIGNSDSTKLSSFGAVRGGAAGPGMGASSGGGTGMAPGAGGRGGNANEQGVHNSDLLKSNEWDLAGINDMQVGVPVLGEADPFDEPDIGLRI
ncbi:hypothetical protein [Mycobacteroides sp. LB1]|uniref:hypothetical protein n=1 Tax=Mycobacteroides sp. LB1 TaxID=2750814 RepID=UPI0015DDE28D|nr:hypothetical protein [Mycobacteroides sp. LB1]